MKLESISTTNKGLKLDGKWKSTTEEVIKYVQNHALVGEEVVVREDDNGRVVFIEKAKEQAKTFTKEGREDYWQGRLELDKVKNEEVRRLACLNTAVEVLKISFAEKQVGISVNGVVELVKQVAKRLEEYVKTGKAGELKTSEESVIE